MAAVLLLTILFASSISIARAQSDFEARAIQTCLRQTTARLHRQMPSNSHWPIDGAKAQSGSHLSYDKTFASVLPHGKTIEEHMRERRAAGKTTHVLDLFGSAVFIRDPHSVDSLTGVRLEKLSKDRLPEAYPSDNWFELEGNLFSPKTWVKLRDHMEQDQISKFDLITIRPEGGYTFNQGVRGAPKLAAAFNLAHLQRAYGMLNPDGGTLLISLWSMGDQNNISMLSDWVKLLQQSDLDVSMEKIKSAPRHAIRITRLPHSPDRLPALELTEEH